MSVFFLLLSLLALGLVDQEAVAKNESYAKTRFPIVMVPGAVSFDSILGVADYPSVPAKNDSSSPSASAFRPPFTATASASPTAVSSMEFGAAATPSPGITPLPSLPPGQCARSTTSWIGNDYSGSGNKWVLQNVSDIEVLANGSLFTNVFWDEGGAQVQLYQNGQLMTSAGHTHGWGYEGGEAVAANGKYLFIAQNVGNEEGNLVGDSWPPSDKAWTGVSRRILSDITKGAPFEGGHGKEGDVLPQSFLPVLELADGDEAQVTGVAASADLLFVSIAQRDLIRIFDAELMTLKAEWKVTSPGKLAFDSRGWLWVLAKTIDKWQVLAFDVEGSLLRRVLLDPAIVATDIAVRGERLAVTDAGPSQQVLIWDHIHDEMPVPTAPFGEMGGVIGAKGQVGPRRFNDPRGVGMDSAGNLFIASNASGTVLESYDSSGNRLWARHGLEFIDVADVDPASPSDLFTKEEHFTIDFSKSAGKEWSYTGYTINPKRYPDDPRLHDQVLVSAGPWVRRLAEKRFLFITDMYNAAVQIFRFSPETDGEVAIPAGLVAPFHINGAWPPYQPPTGGWIWRDSNGNGSFDEGEFQTMGGVNGPEGGMFIDDDGGLWWSGGSTGIRYIPLAALDPKGNPIYEFSALKSWSLPSEFDEVNRIRALPSSGRVCLGGTHGTDVNQHWKPMGPVLACYDNWFGTRKLLWTKVLPYEAGVSGHESVEPMSFDLAGPFIFVPYTAASVTSGTKWGTVRVFEQSNGSAVTSFDAESSLGVIGMADVPESLVARELLHGEYVIFIEDDAKAKVVMFRWCPSAP